MSRRILLIFILLTLASICWGQQGTGGGGQGTGGGGGGTISSISTTTPITGGPITTTGTISCPTCAIGPGSSTANHIAEFSGTDGVTLKDGGPAASGTVTSIATTGPISGGTITSTGTITCPTCAIGPGSSTANHIAEFSGTDGVTLKDGGAFTVTWDQIQNAASSLTLANGTNTTTFNQTNATVWTWANTTAATSGTSQTSPQLRVNGTYWTGAASAADIWGMQGVVANGTNGTSILTFNHVGTTGTTGINAPNISVGGTAVPLIGLDVRSQLGGFAQIGVSDGTGYVTFFASNANDNALYWDVANDMRFGTANNTPLYTTTGFVERFRMTKAGAFQSGQYATKTSCAAIGTAANPSVASCAAAPAGSFACSTSASAGTCQVNTTAVTTNAVIIVQETSSVGTILSVTCNTSPTVTPAVLLATQTSGTGFVINMPTITTNPACFNYWVVSN